MYQPNDLSDYLHPPTYSPDTRNDPVVAALNALRPHLALPTGIDARAALKGALHSPCRSGPESGAFHSTTLATDDASVFVPPKTTATRVHHESCSRRPTCVEIIHWQQPPPPPQSWLQAFAAQPPARVAEQTQSPPRRSAAHAGGYAAVCAGGYAGCLGFPAQRAVLRPLAAAEVRPPAAAAWTPRASPDPDGGRPWAQTARAWQCHSGGDLYCGGEDSGLDSRGGGGCGKGCSVPESGGDPCNARLQLLGDGGGGGVPRRRSTKREAGVQTAPTDPVLPVANEFSADGQPCSGGCSGGLGPGAAGRGLAGCCAVGRAGGRTACGLGGEDSGGFGGGTVTAAGPTGEDVWELAPDSDPFHGDWESW